MTDAIKNRIRGKRLLILGANPETAGLVKRANELGVFTIVTDFNHDAYAKKFASKAVDIDATDYDALLKIAKEVKAGCVVLGGCGNYQTKDQGFGGIKMSGNAREGGHYCLEEFSRIKTIVFRKAFC